MLVLRGRGKPAYPKETKNSVITEQGREPIKNPCHIWRRPGKFDRAALAGVKYSDRVDRTWLAHVFQCLFTFALVSASRWSAEIWRPSRREPQGNWRWNWNARDGVASSPSFSRPAARPPWRTCSQATVLPFVFAVLLKPRFNVLCSYFFGGSCYWWNLDKIRDTAPLRI